MYTPFARLLCVAALASAALAQTLSVISPKEGDTLVAGEEITIQLKRSPMPSWQTDVEVALVIRMGIGAFDGHTLGANVEGLNYQGKFEAQRTEADGTAYANCSIAVEDWASGAASVNLAHLHLLGEYAVATLDFASVNVNVVGVGG